MDYICGPVILYSQDKIRMLDFLSDVFEFEVDSERGLVQSGAFLLKLIELPEKEKENFQSLGIKFAFKIKDPHELLELVNKYNFFLYRNADKNEAREVCLYEKGQKSLTIKDIDGRIWQFDVNESVYDC